MTAHRQRALSPSLGREPTNLTHVGPPTTIPSKVQKALTKKQDALDEMERLAIFPRLTYRLILPRLSNL